MKEKLRELGIRTTELSAYMKISRPSLYKYIELYESKEYGDIPEKTLRVFKYIDKYKSITKEQVIAFTICEFSDQECSDKKEKLRSYLLSKGQNDPKIELMYLLVSSKAIDDLVQYLSNAIEILEGDSINDEQLHQITRLVNLKSNIMKDIPLTQKEINEAKKTIGDQYVR